MLSVRFSNRPGGVSLPVIVHHFSGLLGASFGCASRSKIPVCSTTRVKSATVFSLMIDGSASRDCRIFGRFRPVRIVRKRGTIAIKAHPVAAGKSCYWALLGPPPRQFVLKNGTNVGCAPWINGDRPPTQRN